MKDQHPGLLEDGIRPLPSLTLPNSVCTPPSPQIIWSLAAVPDCDCVHQHQIIVLTRWKQKRLALEEARQIRFGRADTSSVTVVQCLPLHLEIFNPILHPAAARVSRTPAELQILLCSWWLVSSCFRSAELRQPHELNSIMAYPAGRRVRFNLPTSPSVPLRQGRCYLTGAESLRLLHSKAS